VYAAKGAKAYLWKWGIRMRKQHSLILAVLLTSGCSNYDSFAECVQSELKGDSESALTAARGYCRELMDKKSEQSIEKVDEEGLKNIDVGVSVDDYGQFYFLIHNRNEYTIDNVVVAFDKGDGKPVEHTIVSSYTPPRNNTQSFFNSIPGFTKSDIDKKEFRWWVVSADKLENR